MDKKEHNKLIAKIAKSIFKPEGIIRKGQSRVWLDDNDWYTTVIEFQPSNWGRGSYLNVGVNFNWYAKDYFSFDIGGRIKPFNEFKDKDDFEKVITEYCETTLKTVSDFRKKLNNINNSTKFMTTSLSDQNIWGNYHLAIFYGLTGDKINSEKHFNKVLESDDDWDWIIELKKRVSKSILKLNSVNDFNSIIADIIIDTRQQKKLKEITKEEVLKHWA